MPEVRQFAFRKIERPTQAPLPTPVTPVTPAQPAPIVTPAPVQPAPIEVVAQIPVAAAKVNQPVTQAPQPVAPAQPIGVAIVPSVPTAPALVSASPAVYGDDSDSLGAKDIKLPRINIVQNVGDLMKTFNPGEIVLNAESVLVQSPKTSPDKNKAIRVVICGFRKDRWVEKTLGGASGNIVDTVAEVAAAGGTIDYNVAAATKQPLYQELAEAVILIEKPDNVEHPAFNFAADGKLWAVALWSMKGAAFTSGAKIFRTARKFGWLADKVDPISKQIIEKRAYFSGSWLLNTELKSFRTGNVAWVPLLERGGDTGPEVRELAQSVLS